MLKAINAFLETVQRAYGDATMRRVAQQMIDTFKARPTTTVELRVGPRIAMLAGSIVADHLSQSRLDRTSASHDTGTSLTRWNSKLRTRPVVTARPSHAPVAPRRKLTVPIGKFAAKSSPETGRNSTSPRG